MDPFLINETLFKQVSAFCLENRILLAAPLEPLVHAGAALGVVVDYEGVGRLAAKAVEDLGKMGVARDDYFPDAVSLSLNPPVLERLGLKVPDSALKSAKKVSDQ